MITRMKRALTAAALLLASAAAAQAATFTGNFSLTGGALTAPGLVIQTDRTTGSGSFDLNVGQSISFDLFRVWTNEVTVDPDDKIADTLLASFSLTGANPAAGAIAGSVVGVGGLLPRGMLSWAAPLDLAFGNGGLLRIALENETFNNGVFVLFPGRGNGANVRATISYVSEPTAVPVPAAGLMLLGGMGALAALRRRKAA